MSTQNEEGKRKLAFWELDRGRFAQAIQAAFEKAQKDSYDDLVSAKVSITISFSAPDPNDLQFSSIGYSVTNSKGSKSTSKSVSIERDHFGNAIADGPTPADILQIPLGLPGMEVSPLIRKVV